MRKLLDLKKKVRNIWTFTIPEEQENQLNRSDGHFHVGRRAHERNQAREKRVDDVLLRFFAKFAALLGRFEEHFLQR